jgi:hypothetical protein
MSIFHSADYVVAFVLQEVAPAYFAPGDLQREIQRLSKDFGQSAHVIKGERRSDETHSIIVTWGDVTLTPLDADNVDTLRNGHVIHAGLIMDFLGDAKASAREGMPIYRIGGGAGYIWNATYDDKGKGSLRIAAVNANLIGPSPDQVAAPAPAYATTTTPAATQTPESMATPDPEKIEADRTARIERAIAAANTQMKDAEAFIQEKPGSPDLLAYVKALNALSAAVTTSDPDIIERKSTDLSAEFSHDPDYRRHQANVLEAQKKRTALFLGDALVHGAQQRAFIMEFIAKNPLSPATSTLAELVTQLGPLLKRDDLASLEAVVNKIDLTIRESNLEDAFVADQREQPKAAVEAAINASPTPSPSPLGISQQLRTDKNRFLFDGDLKDVEILYNANASAPHIARNLRDEYVFANNEAVVCLFGDNPDDFAVSLKKTLSAAISAKSVEIGITATCDANDLLKYDIIATQRGAFLRSPRSAALALIKAVENDDYRRFTTVSAADVGKVAQSERAEIDRKRHGDATC